MTTAAPEAIRELGTQVPSGKVVRVRYVRSTWRATIDDWPGDPTRIVVPYRCAGDDRAEAIAAAIECLRRHIERLDRRAGLEPSPTLRIVPIAAGSYGGDWYITLSVRCE